MFQVQLAAMMAHPELDYDALEYAGVDSTGTNAHSTHSTSTTSNLIAKDGMPSSDRGSIKSGGLLHGQGQGYESDETTSASGNDSVSKSWGDASFAAALGTSTTAPSSLDAEVTAGGRAHSNGSGNGDASNGRVVLYVTGEETDEQVGD